MISDVNVNKIIASNKVPFGKTGLKYFIGYKDDRKVRPLCIILPKITAYRRNIFEAKCTRFMIKGNQLPEKYNKNWDKVSNS